VNLEVRAAELAIVVHRPASGDFLAAEEFTFDSVSGFRAVFGWEIGVGKVKLPVVLVFDREERLC
jgi:hypothetical protein